MTVKCLAVPHDAAGPLAFVVSCGGASIGHATDLGHLGRRLVEAMSGCDALLVESNYDPAMLRDGPYPWSLKERILGPLGHLANGDVGRLLETGTRPALPQGGARPPLAQEQPPRAGAMAAEEALSRARRGDVRVTLAAPDGTGWISVGAPRKAAAQGEGQLRLF